MFPPRNQAAVDWLEGTYDDTVASGILPLKAFYPGPIFSLKDDYLGPQPSQNDAYVRRFETERG